MFIVTGLVVVLSLVSDVQAITYNPGETLEPACAPADIDCGVIAPVFTEDAVADGALLYNSAGEWRVLGTGNDGEVLKLSGGTPSWGIDNGGTSYSAGTGLELTGASFALDLTNLNTWSGIQTFSSGFTVGGNTYTNLAGTGLSFAGGTLTASLGTTVESSEIVDGTIVDGDVANGTITFSKFASNECTINQLPKWNGSTWVCGNDVDTNTTYMAGSGLALTAETFSLDLDGLTGGTVISDTDSLAIYDESIGGVRKISRANFLSGVTGALVYQGTWDANANTPALSDGAGIKGQYYVVDVASTMNFGSGSIAFDVGDWVIHNGSAWEKLDSTFDIASVFGRTGTITAVNGDYNASQITNTPSGNISSTNVQAAINELDSNKQSVNATLTSLAGLTAGDGFFIVGNGTDFITENGTTARASLGLGATDDVEFATATLTDSLVLSDDASHSVTIQVPGVITGDYTLMLPATDGDDGEVLTTNGDGALDWISASVDTTVYTNNGTLTDNRFIVLDGNSLTLDGTGDIVFADDGSVVAVDASLSTINISGLSTFSNNAGLEILDEDNSAGVTISVPTVLAGDYSLVLPGTNGDNEQVLSTDGNGNLSWVDVASDSLYTTNGTITDSRLVQLVDNQLRFNAQSGSETAYTILESDQYQNYVGDGGDTGFIQNTSSQLFMRNTSDSASSQLSIRADGGRALDATYEDAGTGVTNLLRLTRTSSGSVANGIGNGIEFAIENSSGVQESAVSLQAIFDNVANSSEDSSLILTVRKEGDQYTIADFDGEALALQLYGGNQKGGELQLFESSDNGSNYLAFVAPNAVTTSTTWVLPNGDGTDGQVLSTNGAGALAWTDTSSAITNQTQTLTDASVITWDFDNGERGIVIITDDRTLAAVTNITTGDVLFLNVKASGDDRDLAFNTLYKDTDGTVMDDVTIPEDESRSFIFQYDGTNFARIGGSDGSGASTFAGLTDTNVTGVSDGSVLYYNSGEWNQVLAGTAGQVLAMNDSANAVEWVTSASSGTDLARVRFERKSNSPSITFPGSRSAINFPVTRYAENVTSVDASTGSFVVQNPGKYRATASILTNSIDNDLILSLMVDGSQVERQFLQINQAGGPKEAGQFFQFGAVDLIAGQTMAIHVATVGGGNDPTGDDDSSSLTTVYANEFEQLSATGGSGSGASTLAGLTDTNTIGAAAGSVLYFNGSSWDQLGVGTNGQVLTAGVGGGLTWATTPEAESLARVRFEHKVSDGNFVLPSSFGAHNFPSTRYATNVTSTDRTTSSFVAQNAGLYRANVQFGGNNIFNDPQFRLTLNGAEQERYSMQIQDNDVEADGFYQFGAISVAIGDTVAVEYQGATDTIVADGNGTTKTMYAVEFEQLSATGGSGGGGANDGNGILGGGALLMAGSSAINMDTNVAGLNFDSNTFVIDSVNNRIGIGIDTPTSKLDIRSVNTLVNNGSGQGGVYFGTTDPQGANIGGSIQLGGSSGDASKVAFGSVAGRKENSTSANYAGYLQFATNGPAGVMAEAMRIDSTGKVGIGNTAPDSLLEVGNNTLRVRQTGAGQLEVGGLGSSGNAEILLSADGEFWRIRNEDSGGAGDGDNILLIRNDNNIGGVFLDDGDTAWQSLSDRRLKENITELGSVLDRIDGFGSVSYSWIADENHDIKYGVIAQDVRDRFPEAVSGIESEDGYLGVDYSILGILALQGVEELADYVGYKAGTDNAVFVKELDGLLVSGALSVVEHVSLGADTVGEAIILKGDTEVEVIFEEEYLTSPIVTITKQTRGMFDYYVSDVTKVSFTITIDPEHDEDIIFSWHAFAGKNTKRTFSDRFTELMSKERSDRSRAEIDTNTSNEVSGSENADESQPEGAEENTEGEIIKEETTTENSENNEPQNSNITEQNDEEDLVESEVVEEESIEETEGSDGAENNQEDSVIADSSESEENQVVEEEEVEEEIIEKEEEEVVEVAESNDETASSGDEEETTQS